ncbi:hypothetical protein BC828DRAFT_391982, partial [Blastocladiella britannica]
MERDDNVQHGLIFNIGDSTTLPILKWIVEKNTVLNGQTLGLPTGFICTSIHAGKVEMLNWLLCSTGVLVVEWSPFIVSLAIEYNQLAVLEWFEQNQNVLPPQNLDTSSWRLSCAALLDAVDVLAWWHSRYPDFKFDWWQLCESAIEGNSHKVQLWLLDHLNLFAPESDEERHDIL